MQITVEYISRAHLPHTLERLIRHTIIWKRQRQRSRVFLSCQAHWACVGRGGLFHPQGHKTYGNPSYFNAVHLCRLSVSQRATMLLKHKFKALSHFISSVWNNASHYRCTFLLPLLWFTTWFWNVQMRSSFSPHKSPFFFKWLWIKVQEYKTNKQRRANCKV